MPERQSSDRPRQFNTKWVSSTVLNKAVGQIVQNNSGKSILMTILPGDSKSLVSQVSLKFVNKLVFNNVIGSDRQILSRH